MLAPMEQADETDTIERDEAVQAIRSLRESTAELRVVADRLAALHKKRRARLDRERPANDR